MFTEKTLGKIELLEWYLQEKLPNDELVKAVLSGIMSDSRQKEVSKSPDFKIEQKKSHQPIKKYPERIDLSKTNKQNFQNLVNKSIENKKWDNSTVLNRATYNKSSKTLTVYEKRHIIKEYPNIPVSIKEALFKNGKPGKYYHTYIKGHYKSKDVSLIG